MSTDAIPSDPETVAFGMLNEGTNDDFFVDILRIAEHTKERAIAKHVLGRALLTTLPENGEFPDSFFTVDLTQADHQVTLVRELEKHQTAARLPRRQGNYALNLTHSVSDRQRIALLFHQYPNAITPSIAEALWPPVSDGCSPLPWTLEDAVTAYRTSREICEERIQKDQIDTFLRISRLFSAELPGDSTPPPHRGYIRAQMRWLIKRDMPEVLDAERAAFDTPWAEEDFLSALRQSNTIGMVAEANQRILGFMIYELHKSVLYVMNLAVHPDFQMMGIGTQMVEKLIEKLEQQRRTSISIDLLARRTGATAFLQKKGFNIIDIYDSDKEPAIRMQYSLEEKVGCDYTARLREVFLGETTPEQGEHSAFGNPIDDLLERSRDSGKRREMLRAFRSWTMQPDCNMVYAIARQGWDTITGIKGVLPTEWRQPDGGRAENPAQEKSERRELREMLQCREHRIQLHALQKNENLKAQDARERSIVYSVFEAGMTYPYHGDIVDNEKPLYDRNTPNQIVQERAFSCFGGPWVMAAMLAEAGIPMGRIFYCDDVQSPTQGYHGAHGSLLIRSCDNNLILLDTAKGATNESIRTHYVDGEGNRESFEALLLGESKAPLQIVFNQEKRREHGLPMRMQVMPAPEGFASVHMMNTGLQCMHERSLKEAQYAFELGLEFNPLNTYILSHLGLTLFQRGDINRAKEFLSEALAIDPRQLYAHFTLAEIALAEGDVRAARRQFKLIDDDRRNIYGDNGKLKGQSRRYLQAEGDAILSLWYAQQAAQNPCGVEHLAAS